MSITTVRGGQLRDNTITEPKLKASNSPSQNQSLIWDGTQLKWADVGASTTVTQASHGFSAGNILRHNGTSYVKAQSDSAGNAEVIGIISNVIDANNFVLTTNGYVSSLSGFTAGVTYFLSASSAGALTSTEPSTAGQISKPLFLTDSTTSGYFFNFRGIEVPSAATVYTTDNVIAGEGVNESPNDAITDFTVDNNIETNSESVILNGVRLNRGGSNDYTVSGDTITFAVAPETGATIIVDYLIAS